MDIDAFPNDYFEALGAPKPGRSFNLLDDYRFHLACKFLSHGSVLDVGAYYGDFLQLARKKGHQIFGTEVNQERVNLVNKILGKTVVRLDFRNGKLGTFSDNSVDNVVCTEVLEHVHDHKLALSELCRVARKKVILTVPYQERISHVLCVHCFTYTPYYGHLHSYSSNTLRELVPKGFVVKNQIQFGKRLTGILIDKLKLPRSRVLLPFVRMCDSLFPNPARWLLAVITPKHLPG